MNPREKSDLLQQRKCPDDAGGRNRWSKNGPTRSLRSPHHKPKKTKSRWIWIMKPTVSYDEHLAAYDPVDNVVPLQHQTWIARHRLPLVGAVGEHDMDEASPDNNVFEKHEKKKPSVLLSPVYEDMFFFHALRSGRCEMG
jgi:hypothetical protein